MIKLDTSKLLGFRIADRVVTGAKNGMLKGQSRSIGSATISSSEIVGAPRP